MPRISVILPTFNCKQYLNDSITSVLNQTFTDLELIIIDDGSTDGTDETVRAFLKDPRINYIKKPAQKGLSSARNTGIASARGEFVAFLDADDIYLKGKLAKQVCFMVDDKRRRISYTNEIYFKDGSTDEFLSDRYHFSGDVFFYLKRSNFIHISTVMARRDIFKENLFDEFLTSHEDWDFFLSSLIKAFFSHTCTFR